jgi:ferredoxin-NADP reductase
MTVLASVAHAAVKVPIRAREAGVAAAASVGKRLALGHGIEFWLREVDPTWSLSEIRARVVEVIDETHDVKTFVLAPNARWGSHRAGQFVVVEVEVFGVRMSRCYSIASAPGERHLAITVKRVPGGRVSSWMHDRVKAGDVLRLHPAAGELVLPRPAPDKLLLLSGGSGITPVMSTLRDRVRRGAVGDIVFLHAARSSRDVIFARELDALASRHPGLRVVPFLEDREGRLDAAKLRAAVPDFLARHTLLCGPSGMMDALSPIWTKAGIEDCLQMERFGPATPAPAIPGEGAPILKLSLVRSGRSVTTEGAGTLLEQLERAGERPAYGCRMGICNTCRCRKTSGVVEDMRTGAVSTEPDEEIRLCVSRARTDIELAL